MKKYNKIKYMGRCLLCSKDTNHICLGVDENINLNEIELENYIWDLIILQVDNKKLARDKWLVLKRILTPSILIRIFVFIDNNSLRITSKQKMFLEELLRDFSKELKTSKTNEYNDKSITKFIGVLDFYNIF